MNNKLTKKQSIIIDFINDFTSARGISPSYREIMAALGLSSVSAVAEHIDNLVKKGALRKVPGTARSLEIIDTSYPETTELIQRYLTFVSPKEAKILREAAKILGVNLENHQ